MQIVSSVRRNQLPFLADTQFRRTYEPLVYKGENVYTLLDVGSILGMTTNEISAVSQHLPHFAAGKDYYSVPSQEIQDLIREQKINGYRYMGEEELWTDVGIKAFANATGKSRHARACQHFFSTGRDVHDPIQLKRALVPMYFEDARVFTLSAVRVILGLDKNDCELLRIDLEGYQDAKFPLLLKKQYNGFMGTYFKQFPPYNRDKRMRLWNQKAMLYAVKLERSPKSDYIVEHLLDELSA